MGWFALIALMLATTVGQAGTASRTWAGAIHVHTRLSHDSRGTFEEIARAARVAGLSFVILSDHPGGGAPEAQPQGMVDGVLFIRGIETDHLLALGITHALTATSFEGRIAQAHAQGGVVFVAHPEGFAHWDAPGLDGTEIYNLHADVADEFLPVAVPRWLWRARHDLLAAMLTFFDYPAVVLRRWDERAGRAPFAGLAANDAHANVRVGPWTLDPYERQFRFVRTVVEAPRLEPGAILDGLKHGRAIVVFTVLGDPGPVTARAAKGLVSFAMTSPQPASIRLIRNGVPVWSEVRPAGPIRIMRPADSKGAWRFEVWARRGHRDYPWILTNHLFTTE